MLIQFGAVAPTLFLVYLLATLRLPVTLLTAALLQGAVAAVVTYKIGLASWWRPIQLLFPVGLLAGTALHLPPLLFLLLFLFLLGLYWSTFRTQVPYYPSNRRVWNEVRQLLPAGRALRLIDIGSGLGGLTLYLARQRPDCDCVGIELAPLPWLASRLRARLSGSAARFVRGDYEDLDFAQFDMIFAYLSPAAMDALWRKAAAELRPGAMLLSYEFEIDARAPDLTVRTTPGATPLYVWYF
ncbi:trans-aconitate 2-methyltransferase [Rugamonas sp.]|uniref:class I SAM-dependent methyltransferase n=1 Tax=Rugamonas sp. TaxID=1926287 RepID=UPI0025FAE7C9|nr:class I SAM-dependent methyltransferase [Rugamonas sp.]